ncbi:MAG: DNA mismatch repair endonuclease MutL [Tissierellia bacterium]|nr:DNA mismatch repair endonuclease MutL [Tissierellia bacterium]
MTLIKKLSKDTIMKIAAGEVIESPAAIVKELTENSIDANSTEITIEFQDGGITLIRVSDNGDGIPKEDLSNAFTRHATSKINDIDSLKSLNTLGFRGEALPTIAAVTDVEVVTKTDDETIGNKFEVDHDGNVYNLKSIGASKGTTIVAKNLFENLPVRKKFLKSANIESNKIIELTTKLALSNPNIDFRVIKDGKLYYSTNRNRRFKDNIFNLLGREFANSLKVLDFEFSHGTVRGYISDNNFYRSNRSYQYIFINNRVIKNTEISNAIETVYQNYIPLSRYPGFILYIDIDKELIDVNIHPNKLKIKIYDMEELLIALKNNIYKVLRFETDIPVVESKKENKFIAQRQTYSEERASSYKDIEYKLENFIENFKAAESNTNQNENLEAIHDNNKANSSDLDDNYSSLINFEKTSEKKYTEESNDKINNEVKKLTYIDKIKSILKYNSQAIVGTIFLTYIVIQDVDSENLFLIDQHSAHEKIKYEEFKYYYDNQNINSQVLMNSEIIELSKFNFEKILENKKEINRIGIKFDIFGEQAIVLREIPLYYKSVTPTKIINEILDSITKIDNIYQLDPYRVMREACRAAVKSGQLLDNQEIIELLDKLSKCEYPLTCPHGRPTIIRIKKSVIDKLFFRIQD